MTALPAKPILLDGEWIQTHSTQEILNPFTQKALGSVCLAEAEHIRKTLESTQRGAVELAKTPSHYRAKALTHIARQLAERKEEFAKTICHESGKPILDARREVDRAINTFEIASEETKRIPGEILPMDRTPGGEAYSGSVTRFPIGPVLGITPFNFPLNLVAHKVAPCLAAGNSMVLKPAPQTPLTSLLLGEVFLTTDLPRGAFNIIPCSNTLAESMVVHPTFQALSFTGSAPVGWMLKGKAGYKRVLLELGGNAGVIIEPDANLSDALTRCVAGGYGYAGQTCISVQRIFIHQSRYDEFLTQFVERVEGLSVGDPEQEHTNVGPLINEQAAIRVEEWIKEAAAQGARVHTGGERQGSLIQPSVLTDVVPSMKVCCEEVFGPVVTITPYSRFDEALNFLNDSPYGLQAGVYTTNIDRMNQAYHQLEVGAVLINEIPTFRADHMPYGGIKQSGLGREGVRDTILELTEPKVLIVKSPS